MGRTCVGCRQRLERADSLRIVSKSAVLVIDSKKNLPARGAWIHPSSDCLALAIQRNAFGRALKLNEQPDTSGLVISKEQAETMLENK
jgi:predicted RNA-binding protein YlxR (DUF448 family)